MDPKEFEKYKKEFDGYKVVAVREEVDRRSKLAQKAVSDILKIGATLVVVFVVSLILVLATRNNVVFSVVMWIDLIVAVAAIWVKPKLDFVIDNYYGYAEGVHDTLEAVLADLNRANTKDKEEIKEEATNNK